MTKYIDRILNIKSNIHYSVKTSLSTLSQEIVKNWSCHQAEKDAVK